MIRLLFLLHRYLGIAVGMLMAMWCLSGVVMMYVSYPTLDARTRLAHLTPIDWHHCCQVSTSMLGDTDPVPPFRIEMLAGRPVLELQHGRRSARLIDLSTGMRIDQISATQAVSVAAPYTRAPTPAEGAAGAAGGSEITAGAPRLIDEVDFDQWTLEGISPADRPLYHFELRDGQGGEVYVSSSTGQAVQLTTRRERFWNWLGAIPHWLYFADLRHHAGLWSQVVIYTSLVGCFLAATGLYIGVRQLIRRPRGRWSPYHGFNLWHHIAGLFFGVFLLTWVLSGLLSMNPWGLMEGGGAGAARARLRGASISAGDLRATLQRLATAAPGGVVSVQSVPFAGKLFLIASEADGSRRRLDADGAPAPLEPADLRFLAATLHGRAEDMQLLKQGDVYYFSPPGDRVELPVWRLLPRNDSATRYYVDPVSGTLIAAVDRADAHYRWWHEALHRMDFAPAIRRRPQWDVLMWLLMSGVTVISVTGTYLGYRRLTH